MSTSDIPRLELLSQPKATIVVGMTTTANTTARARAARREYDGATDSLAAAEQLLENLRDHPLVDNCYWKEAEQRAHELVREMERHLDWVMDTYSPDECGLDDCGAELEAARS